jgi:osmotically-inducible protein OsmY
LRYAGETILGRADWGDRESDYEHGFRPMHVRDDRDRYAAERPSRPREQGGRTGGGDREVRYAGETALGRADWGDRESDYEHGYRAFREGQWPTERESHAGRGPRGYQRTDQRVWEDVCDRLTDDPRVDASDIEVRVENGEVTLEGSVRSREEKRRAEDAIERITGVRDVHNHLHVAHGGIGEPGAPQTPLGVASPGGDSRSAVKRTATARATAREQSAGTRGRRPR